MTFDEWFHKEYEPADLQIKQYAERKEGLHIPATCYLEDLKKAFEAGLHADVHTDNSKVIAELEEKLANADYFEKEAEEYRKNFNYNQDWHGQVIDKSPSLIVEQSFQDGAEFGYNKANEWHYVKDGLPISDKDKYYFVVDKWNEPMIARFYCGKWFNYSVIDDVIAWKEIVLPKESK